MLFINQNRISNSCVWRIKCFIPLSRDAPSSYVQSNPLSYRAMRHCNLTLELLHHYYYLAHLYESFRIGSYFPYSKKYNTLSDSSAVVRFALLESESVWSLDHRHLSLRKTDCQVQPTQNTNETSW